jgi:branched-chain amino acid transport system permease protein
VQGQGVGTSGGGTGLRALRDLPRRRPELLGLLAVLAVALGIGRGLSAGLLGLGVVSGSAVALQALGMVLVHRSSGIVNFAQVQVGATAAVLFSEMVQRHEFLHFASFVCGPCVPGGADHPTGIAVALDYWLSFALAVGLAALLAYVAHAMLVRRFARAPRLVATVLTIGIAQLLGGIAAAVPSMFDSTTPGVQLSNPVPMPVRASVTVAPTTFTASDIAIVLSVLLACGGLAFFLARSRRGVAVRGAADNAQRARTLGVDVDSLGGVVWLIAGALSGVAACLEASSAGVHADTPLDVVTLVGILAAAVIGGFRSLPMVVAGALALGILEQGIHAGVNAPDVYNAVLLAVISLFLLLQRGVRSRAESEAAVGWLAAREVRPIPEALRRVPVVQTWLRWGAAAIAVVVLAYPIVMSPNDVATATRVCIDAMLGVSLLVLTGWGGQISLGQLAIAGIGAYVAAMVSAGTGVSFVIGVIAGAAAGMTAALLVGLPALRVRGLNLAVSTMAMALTVSLVVISGNYLGQLLPSQVRRPVLLGLALDDQRVYYYLCLLVLGGVLAATAALRRSRTARALIACRENEAAARALGVSPARVRLIAFAVSGAIAGIAGALLAYNEHGVHAPDLTPESGIAIFLMVVIGGMGSLWGPVLGALYIGFLLSSANALVAFLAAGGGVVFVLLVAPGGLVQLLAATRDALLRRVAVRHRIHAPGLLAQAAVEGHAAAPITPLRSGGDGGGRAYVPVRYRLDPEVPAAGGGGTGG